MWLDWTLPIVLTTLAVAVVIIFRDPGDRWVAIASNAIPPAVIVLTLLQFRFGGDYFGEVRMGLLLHHFGFGVLCGFLALTVYLLLTAQRQGPQTVQSYRRLWLATKLLPAPSALLILLSGLKLIYDNPGAYSLGSPIGGFAAALLVILSYMFWDGILIYTGNTEQLWTDAKSSEGNPRAPWRKAHLIIHAVSFPFVFALGYFRPQWMTNPWHDNFQEWQSRLGTDLAAKPKIGALIDARAGWPEGLAAVLIALVPFVTMLFVIGGILLLAKLTLRRSGDRMKSTE
jgi:hypothetical protein